MHRCLYLICPTDYLEAVIDKEFRGVKYYYSSLGNSFTIDKYTLAKIAALIEKKDISEIKFVLTDNNRIVSDALNNQKHVQIKGLRKSYLQFFRHQSDVLSSWKNPDCTALVLAYHLNQKIKELKSELERLLVTPPVINAKLYSRSKKEFRDVYPDLFCMNLAQLN